MQFTNMNNVSLSVAVWLASDTYDYNPDPQHISTTTLMKPVRQIILADRVDPETASMDIVDRIPSSMGTSFHEGIERAWLNGYKRSLYKMGLTESVINRIYVNPTPEDLKLHQSWEDAGMSSGKPIYVYLERRTEKEINGYKVSGKFDFVGDGTLEDVKSTGTYGYMQGRKDDDYRLQGSIYRWLNPDIITSNYMVIQFIFTDWSKLRSMIEEKNGYPPHRVLAYRLPLLSIEDTEQYVINKLALLDKLKDAPQDQIPECTREELWQTESEFKYYKDATKLKRATRNYDTYAEAHAHYLKDGSIGIVKEVKGQVKKCLYCNAFDVCEQKNAYLLDGSLVV